MQRADLQWTQSVISIWIISELAMMTSSERVSRQHATCNNKCVTSIGAHKTQAQEQITQNHKYGRQEALSQWMDIAKVYPSIHDTLERKRNRSKNFAPTKIHRIFLYFHFFSSVSGFVRTFSSWPWQRIAPYYSKEEEKSTWSKTQTHTHTFCVSMEENTDIVEWWRMKRQKKFHRDVKFFVVVRSLH